jgi:NADP-dependent 3-hydroxy acid dehydrogenase YdfG
MVALVTGGSSGIGQAIALAERGAEVVVAGRRADALARTAAARASIRAVTGDVSDVSDAERIVHAAVAMPGRLDVLVDNAGAVRLTPLGQTELDVARAPWATNVLGPTMLAQFALAHLEQTREAIVNVSSTFGHKPAPTISQYGASKAALEQLTRSWALELAPDGDTSRPQGSITTSRCGSCKRTRRKKPRFAGLLQSPLTDSNRRPPLPMEASAGCYVNCERRLVARFPWNLAGFAACGTPSLRGPEPPQKSSNLSPEPSPNADHACGPWWQQTSVAGESAWASVVHSGWWRIRKRGLALCADGVRPRHRLGAQWCG